MTQGKGKSPYDETINESDARVVAHNGRRNMIACLQCRFKGKLEPREQGVTRGVVAQGGESQCIGDVRVCARSTEGKKSVRHEDST